MLVVGISVVLLHVIVIGSIGLWFGLGSPTSWAKFRLQFKKAVFGKRRSTD
jgi:hypothetical protein